MCQINVSIVQASVLKKKTFLITKLMIWKLKLINLTLGKNILMFLKSIKYKDIKLFFPVFFINDV